MPAVMGYQVAEAFLGVLGEVASHPDDLQDWLCLLAFPVCVLLRVPPSPSLFSSHNKAQVASIKAALSFWQAGPPGVCSLVGHVG